MKVIILSGGCGERLFPISNSIMSKQFLRVLDNKESMLQRIFRQISLYIPKEDIYISSTQDQTEIVLNQIPIEKEHIIIEPYRMGTYASVRLICAFFNHAEQICIVPSDSYVDDSFFKILTSLPNDNKISLIGIHPTYPSERYGYIIPDKEKYYFKEKPTIKQAEHYVNNGALWNSGIFSFHSNLFQDNYNELLATYHQLEKTSFDKAILENKDDFNVIEYVGEWKDIGTWNALSEKMHINNKNVIVNNSKNTQVVNFLDKIVVVSGIDNSIIAIADDGILISSKNDAEKIKNLVPPHRPNYEEKRWGTYKVLKQGDNYLVKELELLPHKEISYQSHNNRKETWTIIQGSGTVIIDDIIQYVKSGDIVNIERQQKHKLIAGESGIKVFEVQIGDVLEESDIIKYEK